ncbi:MAG: T9SS type A sorting domain-containing protein [Flavobacteriales bacterium]|nr:T9SS type A sorting domain-containing protein [Flavobacteriales bacterium]
MKRVLVAAFLLHLFNSSSIAQENVGGMPMSMLLGLEQGTVPTIMAAPFDRKAADDDDAIRAGAGAIPLYARFQEVNASLNDAGRWETLPNGDRLWRLRVTSPGASAIELFYSDFYLPEGGRLYVYDESGEQILGGFTSYNNHSSGLFTTALVNGESCIVEYHEPQAALGLANFRITQVGHAYRMVGATKAGNCNVDVMCEPEITGFEQERHGVVRISVVESAGAGWCSGSVVNNTNNDCKPYILTALHCGVSSSTANFNQYKFYYRYQRTGCGTGSASAAQVMTGCAKRASSNDNGGDSGSDFILVETNNPIPTSYQPYWNGWNANNTATTGGRCIHHPSGDEKKVSTFNGNTINSSWGVGNTHWRVTWNATPNGHGVTEGGSSGSPLFNMSGYIIGTLTGGGSFCNSVVPGGQNQPDYFGKMSYHWNNNPGPASDRLKFWLDPVGAGTTTVFDGSWNPCGVVSVEEQQLVRPVLFPNPAVDQVVVTLDASAARFQTIELFDLSGRVVRTQRMQGQERSTMDLAGVTNGLYLLRLVGPERVSATTRLEVLRP